MSQKSSFSVSRLLDVLGAGKTAEEKRTEGVDIAVVVDDGAPRENVLVVRDAFVAEQPSAAVRVLSYADASSDAPNKRDAVLYLVGSNPRAIGVLALSRARAGVPVALVAQSAVELPAIGDLPEEVGALVSEIVVSDESRLADRLARWLIDATDKPIAMAANFPFCRPVLVNSLAARCAAQNAAVGAVAAGAAGSEAKGSDGGGAEAKHLTAGNIQVHGWVPFSPLQKRHALIVAL